MSKIIDNLTLALISLKQDVSSFLDANGWNRKYSLAVSGDENFEEKEIVLNVTNSRTQIELPLIVIQTGSGRNEIQELGDESGKDLFTISLLVICRNQVELITLGNVLRRKLTDYNFSVYDYRNPHHESLGTASLLDTVSDDLSNPDSDNFVDHHDRDWETKKL